jgi:L-amino acid N-acyltransferase YncA
MSVFTTSGGTVTIREATEADAEGLTEFMGEDDFDLFVPPNYDRYVASIANSAFLTFLALHGDSIVGTSIAELTREETGAHKVEYSIYVERPHRRTGLATELLRITSECASGRGARIEVAQVKPDNLAARNLLIGAGFRLIGRDPNGLDAFVRAAGR